MKSKTTFTLSGFVDGPQDGEEDTTQILSTHGPGKCTLLPSPLEVFIFQEMSLQRVKPLYCHGSVV